MNRKDLQTLSGIRLKEAKALFDLGLYSGSYYLAGYAVECAFKACIAKRTLRHDFPDKALVQGLYVHGPRELVVKADLVTELEAHAVNDSVFRTNWDTVKRWSPERRYTVGNRDEADMLVRAIADRNHGIMIWLKRYW